MITKNCSVYSNPILLQELLPKCFIYLFFHNVFFFKSLAIQLVFGPNSSMT